MREELLSYYERELTFLRQMGKEFASNYPKVASRLQLEPDRCEDPHVERLLEAFAFLSARVHLKIDDDFPEITTAVLDTVYPHYTRPTPSMSVVEMRIDEERGRLTASKLIPRGTGLSSRDVKGVPCKFRTVYDTTLWPMKVVQAQWRTPDRLQLASKGTGAVGAIQILLNALPDVDLSKLAVGNLRFYLNGEPNLIHTVYEILSNNCTQILLRDPKNPAGRTVLLPSGSLRPVGFEDSDALLPYPRRSFSGYRLLHEYFTFPEKFFFFDLTAGGSPLFTGFKDAVELVILISRFERPDRQQMLELGTVASTFRLSCTPIVNLFSQSAVPISLNQTRYEYPVVPDARRRESMEVFSVDEVLASNTGSSEVVAFRPFYSFRHGGAGGDEKTLWHAVRRPAGVIEDGRSELFLSVVDLSGKPAEPNADSLAVRCTCTNYTLPSLASFGNEAGDFEPEGMAASGPIVCLRDPTTTFRPALGRGILWRLISHLSLNYLSLVEEGRPALQELLGLYEFSGAAELRNQIEGIVDLKTSPQFARVLTEQGVVSARGLGVQITFDEAKFVGGGVYLFASVLERFLASYVSMNSFIQLEAKTLQRKETLKRWPPRAGKLVLM